MKKKIGLYGRSSGVGKEEELKLLIDILQKNSILYIYKPFYDFLTKKCGITINCELFTSNKEITHLDCLISVGGDGTFLEASQFSIEQQIPILGVNFGRLGFLAQVSASEIKPALENIFNHNYEIEMRSLINVYDKEKLLDSYALNEVTIQRSNPAMLKTTVWVNSELLSSYWSDGILFSTPTGSTAYSLSVGGPVVMPDTHNFIITPIAPHNLNIRPIIISDNSEVMVEVITRKGDATLSIDNKMFNIPSGTKLKIKKSEHTLNFIKFKDYNFFKTLHTKLNWGKDIRN